MRLPIDTNQLTPPSLELDDALAAKYSKAISVLAEVRRVIVAFSAGVDSTLVLKLALDSLGPANVLAATGVSPSLAARELQSVKDLADLLHAPLELIPTS